MKPRISVLLTVVLMSAGLSPVIASPIYPWQEEQGRTHFSDRPLNQDAEPLAEDYSIPPSEDSARAPEQAQRPNPMQQQIDYFYQRRDAERQARLEEQRIRQLAREQELQARQLQLEAERQSEPDTVIINSMPYYGYRPYWKHRHHRRGGVKVHSPYARQLLKQNNPQPNNPNPTNRYPNYPLNFWKH